MNNIQSTLKSISPWKELNGLKKKMTLIYSIKVTNHNIDTIKNKDSFKN